MTQKTKGRSIVTLTVLLALGAIAALLPWPSILGNSDMNDGNVVEVTVAFSPSPRPKDFKVQVTVVNDRQKFQVNLTESPWGETYVVKKGAPIKIYAIQTSEGTLSCGIKVNGEQRDHDQTQSFNPIECLTVV